jgi:1-acyl-sn-glycerol-3-phosphate acyltransferase
VQVERWVLHHYGIALLVPNAGSSRAAAHKGMSNVIAAYLCESDRHVVLIFPAGRAIADPLLQLNGWSTGAVVAAQKSGCPVVPLAFGGLAPGWTPENVIFSAIKSDGVDPPFRIHVRIGKPISATDDPHADLARLRAAVANLMQQVPGLLRTPAESPEDVPGSVTVQ